VQWQHAGWNQGLVDFGHRLDSQLASPQKAARALGRYKRGQSAKIRAAAMLLGPPCGKRSDIAQIWQLSTASGRLCHRRNYDGQRANAAPVVFPGIRAAIRRSFDPIFY